MLPVCTITLPSKKNYSTVNTFRAPLHMHLVRRVYYHSGANFSLSVALEHKISKGLCVYVLFCPI